VTPRDACAADRAASLWRAEHLSGDKQMRENLEARETLDTLAVPDALASNDVRSAFHGTGSKSSIRIAVPTVPGLTGNVKVVSRDVLENDGAAWL